MSSVIFMFIFSEKNLIFLSISKSEIFTIFVLPLFFIKLTYIPVPVPRQGRIQIRIRRNILGFGSGKKGQDPTGFATLLPPDQY